MRILESFMAAAILILPPSIVSVAAQQGEVELFVQIKGSGSESGVLSEIWVRHKSEKYKYDETDANGRVQLQIECKPGMFLYADPRDWSYTNSREKRCDFGEFRLEVEEKHYASLLRAALDINALKSISGPAKLGKLPESLDAALKANDIAVVSLISTEVHARLKAKPGMANPEPYRVLALDAGLQAVVGDPLLALVNADNKQFELPDPAIVQILALQSKMNVAKTGALDWKTLNGLTGMNLDAIYFNTYRPGSKI